MVSVKNDYSLLSHIGMKLLRKVSNVLQWNSSNPHPAQLIRTNLFHNLLYLLYSFYHFLNQYYRPRTDTCKTRDSFKVQVDGEGDENKIKQVQAEWELHKRKRQKDGLIAYHYSLSTTIP